MELRKIKKSQQEIVGFIIIVMMVLVVAVIFMGIWLRPKPMITNDDAEISNFLITSLGYTSECYRAEENKYLTIEELISRCIQSDKTCSNNRKTCEILNTTYTDILSKTLMAGELSQIKYYKLSLYYNTNSSDLTNRILVSGLKPITEGNLSGCINRRLASVIRTQYPGEFTIELDVCRNS